MAGDSDEEKGEVRREGGRVMLSPLFLFTDL